MRYNKQSRLDSSQVRQGGGRGKVAIGGVGGVLVLIIALYFGIDPGQLGGLTGGAAPQAEASSPTCRTGADIETDRDCRFVAFTNSIQDYWSGAAKDYQQIQVNEFTDQVSTGCGTASAAVGPFYCPADTTVYLDLGFFDQLKSQLGAKGGDAAEAYVLAHEFGHHIQNLTGAMQKVQSQGQEAGADSGSVRLELQADCYAGVWFAHATDDPDGPIAEVTRSDLDLAVDAAAAVGDDRIQEKAQGTVDPESWTHGSAAQRQKWLRRGFDQGKASACDTFSVRSLG